MTRDRFATRAAILEGAATLVAAHGVDGLGVNTLAEAAGCDKVLIYRYFGGLEGVLHALGEERMMWPRVEMDRGGGESGNVSLAQVLESVLLEEWAALSSGALMRHASAAELTGDSPLGQAAAAQRADRHSELIATLRSTYRVPPYVDLAAVVELLSAALTMFALRATTETVAHPNPREGSAETLDPRTSQGWRRIEKTVGMLARALLES
jgi:AcrR family transcriptional regulator